MPAWAYQCRLEARPMREAAEWMEPYREQWERRLDRLDDYLKESQKNARRVRKKKNRGPP